MAKTKEPKIQREAHILCFAFPAQGHISPILQFCKRLASKGLKVTLVSTCTSSTTNKFFQTQANSIKVEFISDGTEEEKSTVKSTEEFFELYKVLVSQSLSEFMEKQLGSENPPKFVIYDSIIPWIFDVARSFAIEAAPFFTQPWAVNSVNFHFLQGKFKVPVEEPVLSLPSMPPLKVTDLPSYFDINGSYPLALSVLVNQFTNMEKPKWLFCNSFDKLEEELVKWMASKYPVKNIGPSIPSKYFSKQCLENDKAYGLSLFKPNTDTCMTWLDSKDPGSVVYVSFGSVADLEKDQMEEVAWGLKKSNTFFLWVVRESESEKLTKNFSEETSDKGLIVTWCLQPEVLAHKSVGCFMTHCGWNSTLEALCLGLPMVAMPRLFDQTTNAKYVEDVWGVGVRVRLNEERMVTREEVEVCIREIMEGERGKEIRRNSEKWKKLAKEAIDEGGSSDKTIEELVQKILSS
ncbi:mogroside IE synthase-like [Mangifera indica]|uniref:mogroside IE synthase-like n=1 Tax=Mangifera indica TaxID=29780 RepID=UPI001CF9578E|nr:mogroside IE synthase-like [Mangifera indica]